ncbi:MAG: c-type cytochrome [Candidatus Eiseniibacteriota bacterium]
MVKIMNMGFGRSLGVSCLHCHVADKWDSDEKPTKQVAREMITMSRAINEEYLSKIKGLKSERPVVNCTTCHRGQKRPAIEMAAH